jgi:drug/metabolite transporter (DMT)-like permease
MERASELRAHFALLFMVVIWAVNFSVAKIALEELSPLAFNAVRFPMAAALLYLVLRARGAVPLPTRAELPRVLALGLLGNLMYQMFFIFGLDRTRAGNASLLLASTPIITALLSAALGHERVRPRVWVGVVATFGGILLVVLGGRAELQTGRATIVGDLLMFGASITWAFYTVGSRALVERYGPLPITAWTLWIGSAGLVCAGILDALRTNWQSVDASTWAAVVYAGVLSIGVAYIIWYYGVDKLGNTRTAAYSNITPVIALGVAWLWLGEVPTTAQLAGTVVILTGVTVAQSGRLVLDAQKHAVVPE